MTRSMPPLCSCANADRNFFTPPQYVWNHFVSLTIFFHMSISDRLERVGALKGLVILRARVGRTGAVEGDLEC